MPENPLCGECNIYQTFIVKSLSLEEEEEEECISK
jgi:hypothetical protein